MNIPVIHFFDNNYVIPAAVSFYSMLSNASKEHRYILYVGHIDISKSNQKKLLDVVSKFPNAELEFIDMKNKFAQLFEETLSKWHYTKEIYYKFIVPSLLVNYNKVIVTDVDVVFIGDISKDFIEFDVNGEDKDRYLAGVRVLWKKNNDFSKFEARYSESFSSEEIDVLDFAGGYYIFNLRKMREDDMEEKFIQFAQSNYSRIIQPEQDVINICCGCNKKALHPKALVCSYHYRMFSIEDDYKSDSRYPEKVVREALDNPIQLHYATSEKPWLSVCPKQDVWFYYLTQTGVFYEFMKSIMPKNKKRLLN